MYVFLGGLAKKPASESIKLVLYLNIVNHVVNKETNPAGEAEEESEDGEEYRETGEDEIQDEEEEVLTVVIRITHCPHWAALLCQERKHVLHISQNWSDLLGSTNNNRSCTADWRDC